MVSFARYSWEYVNAPVHFTDYVESIGFEFEAIKEVPEGLSQGDTVADAMGTMILDPEPNNNFKNDAAVLAGLVLKGLSQMPLTDLNVMKWPDNSVISRELLLHKIVQLSYQGKWKLEESFLRRNPVYNAQLSDHSSDTYKKIMMALDESAKIYPAPAQAPAGRGGRFPGGR